MDADSSSKFIGSLTKFLQSLCNGYVEFQRGVELVGHIYLSIDTGEKVDYILHEKVNKNDENSVTFVSNSFHAFPPKTEKERDKNQAPKHGFKGSASKDTSDDDDIMIVDNKGVPGSTNLGTIPSRGLKRTASPGSDQRTSQWKPGNANLTRGPGSNVAASPNRRGPVSTVTSHDTEQHDISMGDMKLEQISADELLSLASQVGEGASSSGPGRGPVRVRRSSSLGDAAGQPVWIKQEAPDESLGGSDTGWAHGRDGQSDSSNSGSNLYPVMMHQSPAAFSSAPVFPGFPSTSISHHGISPGTSASYGNPMTGTSGIDPADWPHIFDLNKKLMTTMPLSQFDQIEWSQAHGTTQHFQHGLSASSLSIASKSKTGKSQTTKRKYSPANFQKFKQDTARYERWKVKMREVSRRSYRRRQMRISEDCNKQDNKKVVLE